MSEMSPADGRKNGETDLAPAERSSRPDVSEILELKSEGDDVFRADRLQFNHIGAIFGGCYLGQAVVAAAATVGDKAPSVMFARFLSTGDPSAPVFYHVARARDGRSFSERRVTARQAGRPVLFEAMLSFHALEEGFAHEQKPAPDAENPEELASMPELRACLADIRDPWELEALERLDSIDCRLMRPEDYFTRCADAAKGRLWVRAREARCANGYAVVAYLSDFMMPAIARLPHTHSTTDRSIPGMSLNHVVWFHAEPSPGDWFLHEAESPWAGRGRGLTLGRLYARSGRLLACTSQELLMRKQH